MRSLPLVVMRVIAPVVPIVCAVLAAACAGSAGSGRSSLEVDGAWTRVYPAGRDETYHAAMAALMDRGYVVERANPLGGSFVAKSAVRRAKLPLLPARLSYTLAHVVVEPAVAGGSRVRLSLYRTAESSDGGRQPNNDARIDDRARYEAILDEIGRSVGRRG